MNFTHLFSNINPKQVITNLPDAVFVVDFDGKILWVNDKASIIFESTKLNGLIFDEIVIKGMELANESYSKRNSVVTGAFTISGKEIFVEMNAKKYEDQYFITIRDITTMTNILAAAEKTGKLNKEKNIMLAKLSNELKSPLQSIIGFSQALLDGLGGDINEKQNKYVKIINKNSSELLHFINKLIEFSFTESSLLNLSIQPFDLINTIQNLLKDYETILDSKNINMNFDCEEFTKKTVYTNENAIKTILQNLFETSINLTDSGSITLRLAYGEEPDWIEITISDTGVGFAQTDLDELFEPYAQLDKANKKTIVRSIALGTAYSLAKQLGGDIKVKSEVMKGTEFSIYIPTSNPKGQNYE